MTLIFIVTVAILCIYPVATFQPEESTDSYYEDVSPKGSVHRPSVGLPIGSWNILDLNTTSKTSVCNDQLLFCDVGYLCRLAQTFYCHLFDVFGNKGVFNK
ncbi:hypothetical protein CLU79DRAFT_773036 [Phycomyces nitens]|nr:hypothetical protein CLU79DRAFT_773036 [Phycomyces nitens]